MDLKNDLKNEMRCLIREQDQAIRELKQTNKELKAMLKELKKPKPRRNEG